MRSLWAKLVCLTGEFAAGSGSSDGTDRHAIVTGELIANLLFCCCHTLVSAGAGLVFSAARVPEWPSTTAS